MKIIQQNSGLSNSKTHSGTGQACRHSQNLSATNPTQMERVNKDNSYPELALQLFERGLQPIPIAPRQKYPTIKGWQSISLPISPWPKNYGIGLRTGELTGIDIDIYDTDLVDLLVDNIRTVYPEIITRVGYPPKVLIPAIVPGLSQKTTTTKWLDEHGVINQIELLNHGQQFVSHGIHPDTNEPYRWDGDILTASLPEISFDFLRELKALFEMECQERGWTELVLKKADVKKVRTSPREDAGNAPGSIYNRITPIEDVLEHYGWSHTVGSHWRRPGKKRGISGHVENGFLICFTTSTCLPGACDGRFPSVHDSFDLLAYYEHDGDKSDAAKAILLEVAE